MADKYQPENDVKTKINRFLKTWVDCFHFPYSAMWGRAGIPDKLMIQDGRFIGIEAKKTPLTEGVSLVEPSPVQKLVHKLIRKAGGIVIVINEMDPIAQLKREFDKYGIRYNKSSKEKGKKK
tara:strand:+ start:1544 stop:1909 length:366 start_codon:yes stop_codon:yes gene_type:complete